MSDRWPSVAVVVVTMSACTAICLTLICNGVTGTTLAVALGLVFVPPIFGWYAFTLHGTKTIQRSVRFTQTAHARVLEWNQRRVDERRKIEIERQRREAEEQRRRADAQRRRQEAAANARRRRDEEIANAVRPVQIEWHAVQGVNTNGVKTYGIGNEHVYCYSFPTKLKLASIQQQSCCSIKVGMASGHPIDRIRDQVSASKTAMSEPAQVLLVFQTSDCRHLERWLHKQLDRDPNALGREWFLTSPSELVEKFQTYVERTLVTTPRGTELQERDFL